MFLMGLRGEATFEWWVRCAVRGHHSSEGGRDTGPSSQTVESNIIEIHEQAKRSSIMTEANIASAP